MKDDPRRACRRALMALACAPALCLLTPPAANAAREAPRPGRVHVARVPRAPNDAQALVPRAGSRRTPAPSAAAPRAPSGPPLAPAAEAGEADAAAGSQTAEVDPLVANGLGSPLCRVRLGSGELSGENRRNCVASGFVAAAAPTGDFGIDVHIDTGFLGLGGGTLLKIVQELFVQPVWMAAVWATHALIVLLEWGFTIDLLDTPGVRENVGSGLQRMQVAITDPWLGLALACASVLALYNGLIRRRVAQTVGDAALLLAMIAAAMWVTLDPSGTAGAAGGWANAASLGTLATVVNGAPVNGGSALGDSMRAVFGAAVEVPWCYLEFGDVSWCRDPARLDPELHTAALRMATEELSAAGCAAHGSSPGECVPSSEHARALERSAQLLREARTNGAIVLALPANGPLRNSIGDSRSLLRAMCRSSDATSCHGAMAAQAQFRTDGGTWPRVGGLLLIVAGLLGMLLTLGFVAARLLAAALFSLFYLLMAPAAALAPAFGERGRDLFRRWLTQLFAAIVSKLVYSFLLGLMLTVVAVLSALEGIGFWTQWLLMSVFWWSAFVRRHHVLSLVKGAAPRRAHGTTRAGRRTRFAGASTAAPVVGANRAFRKLAGPPATTSGIAQFPPSIGGRAKRAPELDGARAPGGNGTTSGSVAAGAHVTRVAELQEQLERVRRERTRAAQELRARRAAELDSRAARVAADIESERRRTAASAQLHAASTRTGGPSVGRRSRGRPRDRGSFLAAQAELPPAGRASVDGRRREYAALAMLAGYSRSEYERLDPVMRRAARAEVDRELALRAGVGEVARTLPRGHDGSPPGGSPRVRQPRRSEDRAETSRIMEDARAVAERRKRQLGFDRE
jgi:hypothetical protein